MSDKGEPVGAIQQGGVDAAAIAKKRGTWDNRVAFYFVAVGQLSVCGVLIAKIRMQIQMMGSIGGSCLKR